MSEYRERFCVGEHDGTHPHACEVCQVIDLAAREVSRLERELQRARSGWDPINDRWLTAAERRAGGT